MSKLKHCDEDTVLQFVKAGVSPFLVGPAGSGKTTIAQNIADKLKLEFYYVSGIDSEYKLKGFVDAHGRSVETDFIKAYRDGGVFLFDEMDASNPQALTTLNAAISNGFLDAPGGRIKKHKNFHVIGAGNTYGHGANLEYIGRTPLDGATLDRFRNISIDYDPELERGIVLNKYGEEYTYWVDIVQAARISARELEIKHIISPRSSIDGAALLKAGIEEEQVFDSTIFQGLNKGDRIKLKKKIEDRIDDIIDFTEDEELEPYNVIALVKRVKDLSERVKDLQQIKEVLSEDSDFRNQLSSLIKLVTNVEDKLDSYGGIDGVMEGLESTSKILDLTGKLVDNFNDTSRIIADQPVQKKKRREGPNF